MLKLKLDEIIENEMNGSVLRSLCKDYEEGEKRTEYFFKLEQSKAIQKTITCLKGQNGDLITDEDLTCNELYQTLKKFKKNKSPGLDGLTAEFYLEFWESLKVKLMEVYDESYAKGILPESLTTGVIVLLEKKGKDKTELSKWSPITLLGVE